MQPNDCILWVVDEVFKALADPSRRHLLDVLYVDNGQTLGSLCDSLAMARQSASKHLKILEAANLVAVVWHGREKLHYLNPVPLHAIYSRWMAKFETKQLDALHELRRGLENDER